MKTKHVMLVVMAVLFLDTGWAPLPWGTPWAAAQDSTRVSFKEDVFPIIKKNCLPCHAEDNFNPSGLTLDDFSKMMAGGEHGSPVKPGKSSESLMIKKLFVPPPFGDRMPTDRKKKGELSKKQLPEVDIKTIADWIDQGAKDN